MLTFSERQVTERRNVIFKRNRMLIELVDEKSRGFMPEKFIYIESFDKKGRAISIEFRESYEKRDVRINV